MRVRFRIMRKETKTERTTLYSYSKKKKWYFLYKNFISKVNRKFLNLRSLSPIWIWIIGILFYREKKQSKKWSNANVLTFFIFSANFQVFAIFLNEFLTNFSLKLIKNWYKYCINVKIGQKYEKDYLNWSKNPIKC